MIIFVFILLMFAFAMLAAGIWQWLCDWVVRKDAKVYPAIFTGFEEVTLGRKKSYYYTCYIKALDIQVRSVGTAFRGNRAEPKQELEVYYNPKVPKLCCIKDQKDVVWTVGTSFLTAILLVAIAISIYVKYFSL